MNESEQMNLARRRYQSRGLYRNPVSEKEILLNDLSHRLIPSISTYIFSMVAGICFGVSLSFHSVPLLVLTMALIPFNGPFWGIALSFVTGSFRFFFQSLLKHLISSLLFFAGSIIIPLLNLPQETDSLWLIDLFTPFTWSNAAISALCGFLTIVFLSRSIQQMPQALNNGAMFFLLFPLGLIGTLLCNGNLEYVFPCFSVSLIYGLIMVLSAMVAFLILRLVSGKGSAVISICVVFLLGMTLFLNALGYIRPPLEELFRPAKNYSLNALHLETYTPTATSTATSTLTHTPTSTPTLTFTSTSTMTITSSPTVTKTQTATSTLVSTNTIQPTRTFTATPTRTLVPSKTPTPSVTPILSVPGLVVLSDSRGANVRKEPTTGSAVITVIPNYSNVEVLSRDTVEADHYEWLQIKLTDGSEGWINSAIVYTVTPTSSAQ